MNANIGRAPWQKQHHIDGLRLGEDEAFALAQLVKRIGWTEMRALSVDEQETYAMRAAVTKLQRALAAAGFAPR
jgi:hypothetical protein